MLFPIIFTVILFIKGKNHNNKFTCTVIINYEECCNLYFWTLH